MDFIKDTVEAINVLPKMCQCRKIIRKSIPLFDPLNLGPSVAKLALTTATSYAETYKEKLKVDYGAISPNVEADLIIRIGDKARLVD